MDGQMHALRTEAQVVQLSDQLQAVESRLGIKEAQCADMEKKNKDLETKIQSVRSDAHLVCGQWKANAEKAKERQQAAEEGRRAVDSKLAEADKINIDLKNYIDRSTKDSLGLVDQLKKDKMILQNQLASEVKKADDADRERCSMGFKLDSLEKVYKGEQEKLQSIHNQCNTKNETIHTLQQQLEQRDSLVRQLQSSLEKTAATCSGWERDCLEAMNVNEVLRTELKHKSVDVETQFKNVQVLKGQLCTTEQALEAKNGGVAEAQAKTAKLLVEMEAILSEKTAATEKNNQLDEELSILGGELKAVEAEKKELQAKVTLEAQGKQQLQQDYTALEEDRDNTQSSLQAEIAVHQGIISDLQEKLSSQDMSLTKSDADLAASQADLVACQSDLETCTSNLKETKQHFTELQVAHEDTQTQLNATNATNLDLVGQLEQSKTLAATLTARLEEEMTEHTASAETLAAEMAELQQRALTTENTLSTQVSELEGAVKSKTEQLASSLVTLNEIQAKFVSTNENLIKSRAELLEAQRTNETMAKDLLAEQHRGLALTNNLDVLRADSKATATKHMEVEARYEQTVNDLKEENNTLSEEVMAQSSTLARVQLAKDEAETENTQLVDATKAQSELIKSSESTIANLQNSEEGLRRTVDAKSSELAVVKAALAVAEQERDEEALQGEQFHAQSKRLEEELQSTTAELEDVMSKLEVTRRTLVDVKEERVAVQSELSELIDVSAAKQAQQTDQIDDLTAKCEDIESKFSQAKTQAQQLDRKYCHLVDDHQYLDRKYNDTHAKYLDATAQSEEYQQQYSNEVDRCTQLERTSVSLQEKLAHAERVINDLQAKTGDADSMLTQGKDERRNLKERVAELEDSERLRDQDLTKLREAHKTVCEDLELEQAKREKLKEMFTALGDKLKESQKDHQAAEDKVTEVANKHDAVCVNFKKVHAKYISAKEQLKTLAAGDGNTSAANATANATLLNATAMLAQASQPLATAGARSAEDVEIMKRQDEKIKQQLQTLKKQQLKIDHVSLALTKLMKKGNQQCDRYIGRCQEVTVLQESVRVLTNRLMHGGGGSSQDESNGRSEGRGGGKSLVERQPLNTVEGLRRVPKRVNSHPEGEGAPANKAPRRAMHNTPHNQTF